jgi:hypothetical protein
LDAFAIVIVTSQRRRSMMKHIAQANNFPERVGKLMRGRRTAANTCVGIVPKVASAKGRAACQPVEIASLG